MPGSSGSGQEGRPDPERRCRRHGLLGSEGPAVNVRGLVPLQKW